MITCPGCQKMLPDWSKNCQFCGVPVDKVVRPKAEAKKTYAKAGPAPYIWVLYYLFAALWIVDGTRVLLAALGALPQVAAAGSLGQAFSGMLAIMAIIGGALILLGIGLIFKVELARGIVNVMCWISILGGMFNLVIAIFASPMSGVMGIVNVFLAMFTIAWTGAQIWVIGETD